MYLPLYEINNGPNSLATFSPAKESSLCRHLELTIPGGPQVASHLIVFCSRHFDVWLRPKKEKLIS